MIRARFHLVGVDDCRPIKWPIKHPYWCTGYNSDDDPIVVAYADSEEQILELWPEADAIEFKQADKYLFTTRFPKPDWLIAE